MPRNRRARNERRLTHVYSMVMRRFVAGMCLIFGTLLSISSAHGQPASSAAPNSSAAPSATPTAAPVKPRSAVEVHKERVDKFRALANALYTVCNDTDLEPKKSAAKTAVAREVADELTALRTAVENLKKEAEKTDGELANVGFSGAEATELTKLEADKANLPPGTTFPADKEKRLTELRIKKSKFQELTLKLGAQKASLASKSTQLALWTKKAEDAAADVESAFLRFTRKADAGKGVTPGICSELCGSTATVLDVCTFREAVPATAAVLADWASVDALSEYIGKPRADILDKYGVKLTDLPSDVFFDPLTKKAPKDAEDKQDITPKTPAMAGEMALVSNETDLKPMGRPTLPNLTLDPVCENRVERREPPEVPDMEMGPSAGRVSVAASATGLAGLDLSGASVATAEVALAALAKVIEDRTKRESLVWFLEKMHTKICGNDEDEKTDQALDEHRAKLAPVESSLIHACQAEWDAEVRLIRAKEANRPDAPARARERTEKVQARQQAAEKHKAVRDQAPTCGPDCQTRREIRTYWLPTTCRLAKDRMDYVQYGGGASLVRAMQGAVATDVRGWPSQMAGFGVGSVYFLTGVGRTSTSQRDLKEMFACGTAATDDTLCTPTLEIRKATAKLVGQIQTGVDPTVAMYAFSAEVNRLNVKQVSPEKGTLHNIPFETAACLVSLPRVFQSLGEQARATTEGKTEEAEALLYAGLAGAPACFTITGNGYDRDSCPGFKPGANADALCTQPPTLYKAVDRGEKLERLTTLVRWYATAKPSTERILEQWENVRTAWENFYAAAEALRKSGGGAAFVPPEFDSSQVNNAKTFAEVMKAFDAYMKDVAHAAQQTPQVKLLQAGAVLARASLEFGVILTDGLGKITQSEFYPGLGLSGAPVSEVFKVTSVRLSEMVRYVTTAESALNQDWGAVVASIVASVRTVVESQCKADDQCKQLVERLSRYSGLFSALISERDPDKVAEALDAAAMPLGGWRQKQIPGGKSLSITSFAGMGTGMEWRWGQYGVTREGGRNMYWAPPTLQLPVGIDYAQGYEGGSWGIFIPLIDPAAYLNYDPDKQGRLPGAQLVTVLAPGVAGRLSLGETPFALTVYAIFRPALRAWESDVTSPGANALQLGASLSVDVTLFELWADRKH